MTMVITSCSPLHKKQAAYSDYLVNFRRAFLRLGGQFSSRANNPTRCLIYHPDVNWAFAERLPKVADRVLYGSDWLMLSKERHWASYARELFDSISAVAPDALEPIFSGNARKLYGAAIDRQCA